MSETGYSFSHRGLGAFATLAVFAWPSFPTLAAEPLSAEIPSRAATVEQLVKQITQAASTIDSSEERLTLLTDLINDVHAVPFEQRRTLTELFEQDALRVTDEQRLFGTRTTFFIASPDLALRFARRMKQQRFRDAWLSDLVAYYMSRDRERGRALLAEIEGRESRAAALIWIARDNSSEFDQVRSALIEAKSIGIPVRRFGPERSVFADSLARFTPGHLNEIVTFLKSQFTVEDTVEVLCVAAFQCRKVLNEPELGARLLDAAANLVPNSTAPANPTKTVLLYGYADRNRQNAIELFDKYLADGVPKLPATEERAIQLALVGTDPVTALANAERIAVRCNWAKDEVLGFAIPRIAQLHGGALPLQWLQEATPSSSRDLAVASVAAALKDYINGKQLEAGVVQGWVNILSQCAIDIRDERIQFSACEQILKLAEAGSATVSQPIRSAYVRLSLRDEARGVGRSPDYLRLLSIDKQRAEIVRRWEQPPVNYVEGEVGRIRATAWFVRDSTLPVGEKRAWFERLLAQAHQITNLSWRASTLSALAIALGNIDPDLSLRVHWEELALAKQLGLKPTIHDWGDGLGTMHALATPDEAIEFTFRDLVAGDERIVNVLWSFVKTLENDDDRKASLEAIGKLLIVRQDFSHAAGVAALLSDPIRQARLSAKIVRAYTEKVKGM